MVQTICLDEIIAEINDHPDNYRNGTNLTPEQRGVINPEDTWEIAFIAKIPSEVMTILDGAFYFLDKSHYNRLQKEEWMQKQKDLLRLRIGREPTGVELIDDAQKNNNYARYRLCYIFNHPENVAIREDKYPLCEDIVGWFLAQACRLNPKNAGGIFPAVDYFSIIEKNTTEHS